MKVLTVLKVLFFLGVASMVAGDACILVNFFNNTIVSPFAVVIMVSVGVIGVLSGIVWYIKSTAMPTTSDQSAAQ